MGPFGDALLLGCMEIGDKSFFICLIAAALLPRHRIAVFIGVMLAFIAHILVALYAVHIPTGASSLGFRSAAFALISIMLCYDYKLLCDEEDYPVLIKTDRRQSVFSSHNSYNPSNPFNEEYYGSVSIERGW